MGMTLKELLTKGEGTLSAQEAKALAAQCRMDVDTLYTLLEERGIKILEEENEPEIYHAIRFGSVVENVIMDPETRELDFTDRSLTENTRVGYPVETKRMPRRTRQT